MSTPDPTADLPADPPTRSLAPDPATGSMPAEPPTAPDPGDPATRSGGPPSGSGPSTEPYVPAAAGPAVVVPGYRIEAELGHGGMGVVYRAVQLKLSRTVALKMVLGHGRATAKTLVRFLAEAEAAAAVKHPHVVGVYDFGEAGGHPYLAMEYLPGGSLADRLKTGQIDPRAAAGLVGKLAEAVQGFHDLGIVHRDLKPGNVLFDAAGVPKVTDFGLAKRGTGADLTATKAVMGTLAYMAPEQAKGETKFVGPAADIYALGAVLYHALTGSRPLDHPDDRVLLRMVAEDIPDPPRKRLPSVPGDLDLICRKCLEKAPADRYPSAAALADDLRRFAAGESVSVRPAGVVERGYKWARRKPTVAALYAATAAGAVVLAVAAGFGLLWRDAVSAHRQAETERANAVTARGEAERARDQIAGEQGRTAAALKEATQARFELHRQQEKLAVVEYGRAVQLARQASLEGNFDAAIQLLDGTRQEFRGWEWWYVRKLCEGRSRTLSGHKSTVNSLAFSPDGSKLATGGTNGSTHVWSVRDGTAVMSLQGDEPHNDYISAVAWSPDGASLATVGYRAGGTMNP